MSIYLALCTSVLFILLLQLVNGLQLLIILFFLVFGFAAVPVFNTIIVGLTSIYTSL